jgi:tetratricopeptide (TPR) repeat protein
MRIKSLPLGILCILSSGVSFSSLAQGPPSSVTVPVSSAPGPSSDNFASEPYIILHQATAFAFKADGTGYREQTLAVKVQSDATLRQLGVVAVGFASASEHVEFHYVRVRRPDGTVLETNVADAIEEPAPVTREAPFYSDLKQKELPVKGLHVGDTLEWQVRIIRTAAEAPGQFWGSNTFVSKGVVLAEDVELRVPANLTVNVWTNSSGIPAPKTAVEGAERVYRWSHNNLKPTVGPAAEAAQKADETHVLTPGEELDATEGKLPSVAWTTFPDWPAVGAWYRQLEATRMVPDPSIKAKVAELTVGKTSDEDKAHAIYAYVSAQIRYIGVAFGIGRYQPHTAAEVLANQYGDCKDKHTLLASMFSAAGISSDAVLIGEGIRFNQAVPSPEAFNHLITRAHIADQTVWLDATTEVAPWQVLLPDLRDKASLVIPDTDPAKIDNTPSNLPFKPFATFSVIGTLDKDLTSDSEIVATYRDDDELFLRVLVHQLTVAQYGDFVQRLMAGMGFGGTTSQPGIGNAMDASKPITVSFHYHRVKGEDWGKDRITAIFAPISLPFFSGQNKPVSTLLLGVLRTETSTLEMKLPEHWSAELPEAVHAHAAFATCDVTYSLDKATLHAERRLVVLQSKVPVSDWKPYQKWYEDCGAGSVPYIQLVSHLGATPGTPAPKTTASNAAAAKLIDDANAAIRDHQPDQAKELLDQAKALNPQQRNLWGTYGYRAYELGMTSEAIDDYRRELALHPDQTWVYAPLATELARSSHKDEAVATLRSGVAADPANLRLNLALVTLLIQNGDNAAAIAAGTAALKLLPADDPANANLVIAVATSQVNTGAFADAAELLLPVLRYANTPLAKNNAAYLLAETGLHLDQAEAAERSALDALTAETTAWTLDESLDTLKQTSSLLVSSWDTLGYILFREGHLPEARNYIEASWRSRQGAEVGLHLGDLLLALNDPASALDAYQLARAALPFSTSHDKSKMVMTIDTQAKPMADKIDAGIARAKSAGAKPRIADPHSQLQKMRTYAVPAKAGQQGAVEYRLLISQGKVEAVRATSGGEMTGVDAAFQSLTFPGLIPSRSTAKIVISGYLNCASATCEFIAER